MKSFLFAGLFLLIAAVASAILSRSEQSMIVIALATLVGYLFGRLNTVHSDLKQLREALARDWEERHQAQKHSTDSVSADSLPAQQALDNAIEEHVAPQTRPAVTESMSGAQTAHIAQPEPPTEQLPTEPGLLDKASSLIRNYFTGGNLFVRIGILLLFFGVSFLIKYVSERGLFPIEYRLMGIALAAIALLVFGWRLRTKKSGYALLLQGAGIGILYLTIFGAFSIYHLIPALAAFALLFVVSMLAAALAVLQDSRSLAILGFSGGFLAPVLASTGSSNPMGLFSYYAILNSALVAVAWFKAWRPLNLLGFAFTFIIGAAWGIFDYRAEKFATTEPFLLLFFGFYVLIAILFALRQPPKLRGYVDGSLLFGVPLAASGLQYALVKDYEYGVALSSFGFGAFYLLLTFMLWKKAGEGLRLLSEAFLALGVIFTSLAIPFTLDPAHTAAAWGLEGLGLIWLGSRQNRLSVRLFGLLLQAGAGVLVLAQHDFSIQSATAFLNSRFISAMMMALAGIFSARLLYKTFAGKKTWETTLSPLLFMWGLAWLLGGFMQQVHQHLPGRYAENILLGFATVVSLGFTFSALRTRPRWHHAWYAAMGLLPVMGLVLIATLSRPMLQHPHPGDAYGWLIWPLAFAAFYWLLRKLDDTQTRHPVINWLHTLAILLAVVLAGLEGQWLLGQSLQLDTGWQFFWWAVPALLALWFIIKSKAWPVSAHPDAYQHQAGILLAGALACWGLYAAVIRSDSAPLPWLPVLNPVDVMLGFVLLTLFLWWKRFSALREMPANTGRMIIVAIAGLGFLWLNFTVFRIAHHGFNVPYHPQALFDSSLVQTSISILWALSGVVLTILASRRGLRPLWITGGVLLGIVVLKLFVVDLSELSGGGRIISFLIVGSLLTSIGYFAPLPAANDDQNDTPKASEKHAQQAENNEQNI